MEQKFDPCVLCDIKRFGVCFGDSNFFNIENEQIDKFERNNIIKNPGEFLFDEISPVKNLYILKKGWVSISQLVSNGSRQIVRFVLPGEIFGVEPNGAEVHSSSAEAITVVRYCVLSKTTLVQLRRDSLSYSERFIELLDRERLILTNDLTNIGRRDSLARVAYFLVELAVRSSQSYPLVAGVEYKMPLVQRMIADATGLTVIHVNRTLRRLRSEGYLDFHDGRLTVLNRTRLDQLLCLGAAGEFCLEQLAKQV